MINILFSESEDYYRALGLKNIKGYIFHFDGMRLYKKKTSLLKQFDLFVCAFYSLPHNMILTVKFNALGIKTVLVSDGIFDASNSVYNPMVRKYNLTQFFPIIQDCFLIPFNNENSIFGEEVNLLKYMPKRIMSTNIKIPLPLKRKILITTANTAYFSQGEFDTLVELIKDIISFLIKESIDFSVRIFDDKLLKAILSDSFGVFNDINRSFEDALENYSSVITTPSSIVLTSMFHNRSVGQLIYRDTPQIMVSGWLFPSVNIFKRSFAEFYELKEERMLLQNNAVKGYLKQSNELSNALVTIVGSENNISEELRMRYINHINQQQYNMLNSIFNINFEYFARTIYNKFKKNVIFKTMRKILK